jgi:hypothetical protein
MDILNKTLEKMPLEFNSNEFCIQAKKFGFDQYKINQGLIAEFLHKNCKQGVTKRRWKKKIINNIKTEKPMMKPNYYNNTNGSLYKFAEDNNLNSYEFEVIKRIVRCRKKGEWITDIEKTIEVLEIYKKEQLHNYKNQIEILNKTRVANSEHGC